MKITKFIAFVVVAVSLSTTVALTKTEADTWDYGYGLTTAYSRYYAGLNKHGSRVVNRNNGVTSTSNAKAGVWSRASIYTIWDPASFYYKPVGSY